MTHAHVHGCEVSVCPRTIKCSGYPVGSRLDRDLRCVCEDGPGAWLCEDHEDWVRCGGCGNYVPVVNADNECPDCAAETAWAATAPPIDEDPIPFDEAWPARPVGV